MHVGIFAKTFLRDTLEDVLDAVASHEIHSIQFNMACAGLPSMPDSIDVDLRTRIREAMRQRGLTMSAVSGTFNMIHPDPHQRQIGLRRLEALAQACSDMGTGLITLCTGTRDPENMWRHHPDNVSPAAWNDLCGSMECAIEIAERNRVTLAIEPEVSNVVDSASKARRLLDEMGSPMLRVVIDGANLFHAGELPRMREVLSEAFDLLGDAIVLAHAKDLGRDGEAGHEAAGMGALDYDHYITLLNSIGYNGPLILHGLREEQVSSCVRFLLSKVG